MGGYGSGWYRGGRATVEQCRRLDVLEVSRKVPPIREAVRTGRIEALSWVWSWMGDGGRVPGGSIIISLVQVPGGAALRLQYAVDRPDTPQERMSYEVSLCPSPCPFGGVRPWFICPGGGCGGRRTRYLYLLGSSFHCRICHRLTYASRQAHRNVGQEFALACRRQERIQERMLRARSPVRIAKMRADFQRLDARAWKLISARMPGFGA